MKIRDLLGEAKIDEISRGDYYKKATMDKAMSQMSAGFAKSPEEREKHLQKAGRREKGLARAKVRTDKFWAEKNARDAEEAEAKRQANRGANQERLAQLEKEFDPQYDYSDDYSHWSKHKGIAQQIAHLKHAIRETASAGATSAGNVSVGPVYKNKKPKMQKPTDNALDGDNLLTGGSIKR